MALINDRFSRIFRRGWRTLCVFVHRAAPRLIDYPDVSQMRKDYNELGDMGGSPFADIRCLPEQTSRSLAFCAVDFVTPSSLPDVLTKLRKIGFHNSIGDQNNPPDWLTDIRKNEYGGWLRLGSVSRGAPTRRILAGRSVKSRSLPSFVSNANVSLMSVSASLTAIVICFTLEDEKKGVS